MLFIQNGSIGKLGQKAGNLSAYFLFTSILFLILRFFKKNPDSWSYFHAMIITLSITTIGFILRKTLR